jgi:predicted Zn-dependent peptidase
MFWSAEDFYIFRHLSMICRSSLRLCAFAGTILLSVALAVQPLSAQTATQQPESEQLLNGLRLLFWLKPGTPEVILKLRINSGAAFDLAGKSGQMALLGDMLFPDPATVDYFTDEMGGRLNVSVTYDSTTITMVGKASEFEQIVEVLRNALLATQLTPEVVTRMRDARIKLLRDTSIVPAEVADRAIAARLYGDFPYGRPAAGSPEAVARVDRADMMQARDRFLNSNNATLAVIGGVTKQRAMKTVRQLLGPWRKSEQIVPTTFRQPASRHTHADRQRAWPKCRSSFGARGFPDPTRTFHALGSGASRATSLASTAPELSKQPVFARDDAYVLPGAFVMGATVTELTAAIRSRMQESDSTR